MISDECAIIGMQFFYSHQSLKFGKSGGTEMSFTIDGSGGECISNVNVIMDNPKSGLKGIEVSGPFLMCFWPINLTV